MNSLLADQGSFFQNAFITTSLCCPSRASLLTGKYAHNHHVLSNSVRGGYPIFRDSGSENDTLAIWLHAAGYRTGLIGKYLNEYPVLKKPVVPIVPPGWDEWDAPADFYLDDPYGQFNYDMVENGKLVHYGNTEADYFGDVINGKALQFLQSAAAAKSPFFLMVTYISPHIPSIPAPRHANVDIQDNVPRTPNFNEADVSDKPDWIKLNPLLSPKIEAQMDFLFKQRARSLLSVDESIGQIYSLLQEKGLLDNTYIIFTSDNGFALGQHRVVLNKNTVFEEGIRVPMVIRGPNVPAKVQRSEFVLNIDIAPTIADLAGLQSPSADGRSLRPLLAQTNGPIVNWRQSFLVEHFSPWENLSHTISPNPYMLEYQAIRTQTSVYAEYAYGDHEFYNLVDDPYELSNSAASLSPAEMNTLTTQLNKLKNCTKQDCRDAEDGK